jgi:hypothetical protein
MGAEPMGMAPEPTPEEMAAFEQARPQINPTEFSDEILNAGAEIDPAEVQELRQMVMQAQLPAELVEAMLDMVEAILSNPGNYPEDRAELIREGVPEEILPAQFDAEYFGALELALEQMPSMRAPMGSEPMGFADGGIVSLKPIAKELQRYGRNGDTILAHITPAEARMLKRRGGSGTRNPVTGLPEFFIKKIAKSVGNAFKSVGKAVVGAVKGVAKGVTKFVKSPVGKIVTAVALAYFMGPAAASMLGVTSTAGVAAVSGVIGGFGSSILGGDNLKTALRNGAIGGVVAGAGAGIMGGANAFSAGSYTGPTTISGQFNRLKEGVGSLFGADPVAQAMPVQPPTSIPSVELAPNPPIPTAPPLGSPSLTTAGNMPAASTGSAVQNLQNLYTQSGTGAVAGTGTAGTVAGSMPAAPTGSAVQNLQNLFSQSGTGAAQTAASTASPSLLRQYGPYAVAGLGVMGLTGGFKDQPAEPVSITEGTTGADLLAQDPDRYGVKLGPTETIYATPQSRPVEEEYADYYASMRQNPYMLGMAPQQTRMLAQGGPANPESFPRRNGAINGPGTATSDSIPAMLSDGEFVFTARAVRGAGGGSRRDGAKRMYQMMKQFERKA